MNIIRLHVSSLCVHVKRIIRPFTYKKYKSNLRHFLVFHCISIFSKPAQLSAIPLETTTNVALICVLRVLRIPFTQVAIPRVTSTRPTQHLQNTGTFQQTSLMRAVSLLKQRISWAIGRFLKDSDWSGAYVSKKLN